MIVSDASVPPNLLLSSILDAIPAMIVALDRDYRLIAMNDYGARHLRDDLGIEPVLGVNFPEYMTVNNQNNWKERHNKAFEGITTQTVDSYPIDGRTVWSEVSIEPLRHGSDIIGSITYSKDITEQTVSFKEAQESLKDRDTVLKEIHHRVRNNLSTVRNMLEIQMAGIESETAKTVLKNADAKMASIAVLYDKLYAASDFRYVSSREYFEDLIRSIVDTFCLPVFCNTDIDDVSLPASIASTLGIIINELVANSMKYAFDSVRHNQLTVRFDVQDGNALLEISDNGPGFDNVNAPEGSGFGLMLMESFVAKMKGRFDLKIEEGTCWTIQFPFPAENNT